MLSINIISFDRWSLWIREDTVDDDVCKVKDTSYSVRQIWILTLQLMTCEFLSRFYLSRIRFLWLLVP